WCCSWAGATSRTARGTSGTSTSWSVTSWARPWPASSTSFAPFWVYDPGMSSAVVRVPTGPRGGLVLGSLRAFRDDPLRFLVETARDHRPAARFQLGRIDARLFSQPSGIKRILQDNNENYGRQTRSHAALRATLGNGLITSDGDFWRRQRRISQPAFHKQRIAGFGGAMTTAAEQLIDRWRPLAARGEALDIFPELLGLTLKILGRSLFSLELGGAAAA